MKLNLTTLGLIWLLTGSASAYIITHGVSADAVTWQTETMDQMRARIDNSDRANMDMYRAVWMKARASNGN